MNEWQKWFEVHKSDYPLFPKRIRMMWGMFGKMEGKTCKHCIHLERYHQGARWLKCGLSRKSSSIATDWRAGWQACGKYEEDTDGTEQDGESTETGSGGGQRPPQELREEGTQEGQGQVRPEDRCADLAGGGELADGDEPRRTHDRNSGRG